MHKRRNRFEIPWLAAILGTKFPKEQNLVPKTAISCATQNTQYPCQYQFMEIFINSLHPKNAIQLTLYITVLDLGGWVGGWLHLF